MAPDQETVAGGLDVFPVVDVSPLNLGSWTDLRA